MTRRKVTTDELRAILDSRKTMPNPKTMDFSDCWYPVVEDYYIEFTVRQNTQLRREKILLRAALRETIGTIRKANAWSDTYWSTRWEEHILVLTEDKKQ